MLDLLRKGIKDSGCHFKLAYFKPESDLNEEHRRLYNGNIFSVVRQLHYSKKEPLLSLDLALFLNGFPVVTAELKNPLKRQNVQDAVKQYRDTRNQNEPLFKLGRCFAHFAVDPDLVFMIDSNFDLYTKINDDRDFGDIFRRALFDSVYRHLTGRKKK